MRAILNGKPGWRYALVLVMLSLPLGLLLRYGLDVYVLAAAFTWTDVTSTVLGAIGFATIFTLLRRALYVEPRSHHLPGSDAAPPDML
jgi:hypothetical protein